MRKRYLKTILLAFPFFILFSLNVFAASPNITITGISDGPAPYTFTFAVSDDTGLTSVTVNGRELGPNGGTYYDAEWSSYHPGEFNITAVDNEGNTTTKTVSVPGGSVSVQETKPAATQPAPPPETAPPVIPETTAAATVPETRPPETTAAETTHAETTIPVTETEEETSPISETAEESTAEAESPVQETPSFPEEATEKTEAAMETVPVDIDPPDIPDISGILNAKHEILSVIYVPELQYIKPVVNTAVNAHPELAICPPKTYLPAALIAKAVNKGDDITFTCPGAPDITTEVMLASDKSGRIVQIHGAYTPVSMLSYKEGDRSMMLYYIAILLLAVFALYNISVIILNFRRLRLYKAYVLALSGKRKMSPDALIEKAIRKQKSKERKSRSRRKK